MPTEPKNMSMMRMYCDHVKYPTYTYRSTHSLHTHTLVVVFYIIPHPLWYHALFHPLSCTWWVSIIQRYQTNKIPECTSQHALAYVLKFPRKQDPQKNSKQRPKQSQNRLTILIPLQPRRNKLRLRTLWLWYHLIGELQIWMVDNL